MTSNAEAAPLRAALRNAVINVAGAIIPLLLALVTVPWIIGGYGLDRYGVLAIALVLLAYFNVFDLGIGRATTRFLAEASGSTTRREGAIFWSALLLNLVLGLVGGLALAALVPWLASGILRVPADLAHEARVALYGVALLIPIAILGASVTAAFEAYHRFDLANLLQLPASILTQLLPLIALRWTHNIGIVVLALAGVRLVLLGIALLVALRAFPALRGGSGIDAIEARRLLGFGGWLTVTNIVGPLMVNADRLLIGAVLGMAAVAYYSTPSDIVFRLLVLPAALMRVAFPIVGAATPESARQLWGSMVRVMSALTLALGMVALPLLVLGPLLLHYWLGAEFAREAGSVLQILAIAMLVNGLAQVPYTWVQGYGRPDLTAKLHLAELVAYIPLLWVLLRVFGIVGAAVAWTLRVAIDSAVLYRMAQHSAGRSNDASSAHVALIKGLGAFSLIAAASGMTAMLPMTTPMRILAAVGAVALFIAVFLAVGLDSAGRVTFRSALAMLRLRVS